MKKFIIVNLLVFFSSNISISSALGKSVCPSNERKNNLSEVIIRYAEDTISEESQLKLEEELACNFTPDQIEKVKGLIFRHVTLYGGKFMGPGQGITIVPRGGGSPIYSP